MAVKGVLKTLARQWWLFPWTTQQIRSQSADRATVQIHGRLSLLGFWIPHAHSHPALSSPGCIRSVKIQFVWVLSQIGKCQGLKSPHQLQLQLKGAITGQPTSTWKLGSVNFLRSSTYLAQNSCRRFTLNHGMIKCDFNSPSHEDVFLEILFGLARATTT